VAGTIDFRHDVMHDIVVTRPRWKLETSVDVMRWYQMQAAYFSARFQDRKDVIVLNDAFDVAPKVAALWGQYRARLHEAFIRYSVRVSSNARVRLTTNTSAARYSISALECPTIDEAIHAILGAREATDASNAPRPSVREPVLRASDSDRPPPGAGD